MSRFRLSFKQKLLLGILLSIVAVFGTAGLATNWLIQHQLQDQARQQMEVTSNGIHDMVRSLIDSAIKNYLKGIAETNLAYVKQVYDRFQAGEISEQHAKDLAEAFMLEQKIGKSGYITVVDISGGGIKLAVHPFFKGRDIREFSFARQQAKQKTGYMEFEWQNPDDPDVRTKSMWMCYFEPWHWIISAAPFRDEYPQLIDLAGIETALNKVEKQVKGYIFIMDMQGTLLSHPLWKGRNMLATVDAETGAPFTRRLIDLVKQTRAKNPTGEVTGILRYHIKDTDSDRVFSRMMNYHYIPELNFIVGVVTDLDQLAEPLKVIRNTQLAVMAASLLLSFLVILYAVRPLTRSINELAAAVEKIDGGNLDTPLPDSGNDEISRLSLAFKNMQERLAVYTTDLETQVEERTRTLAARELEFRTLAENAPDIIIRYDTRCRAIYVNNRAVETLGRPSKEILGITPMERFADGECLEFQQTLEGVLKTGQEAEVEHVLMDNLAKPGHFHTRFMAERNQVGEIIGVLAIVRDITARKRAEQELAESKRRLETISLTDQLTSIANRRRFDQVLVQEYARHTRSEAPLSLILLDIDHFKKFNDSFGHVSGDECLRKIAEVLAKCVTRTADLTARYGGEEFVCILPETDHVGAVALAEKLRRGIMDLAISHPESPTAAVVTASLGVVTSGCSADSQPASLVEQADQLLYRAKALGRNRVESITADSARRYSLVRLTWRDTYRCGNPHIDSQHQALFQHANQLLEDLFTAQPDHELSRLVIALQEEFAQHFEDEERILADLNFPGLAEHRREHQALSEKANKLIHGWREDATISAGELSTFLIYDVVYKHLIGTDRKFFPFIAPPSKHSETNQE